MIDFLVSLFGNLLAAEVGAWCRRVAEKLVANAAQKLPASLHDRMHEEWSALLNDTPGDLSKLAVAIPLYWKRSEIADQCEDNAGSPISSDLRDTLSVTEDAVFDLTTRGRTVGEISSLLNLTRTMVEYNRITCVQKLSGQPYIGRKDLDSFFVRHKYYRSIFHQLICAFRRERSWREIYRDRERQYEKSRSMKRNGGW